MHKFDIWTGIETTTHIDRERCIEKEIETEIDREWYNTFNAKYNVKGLKILKYVNVLNTPTKERCNTMLSSKNI